MIDASQADLLESQAAPDRIGSEQPLQRPKVWPIQMGEFLRKFVCKRWQAMEKLDILAIMASMRQYGCGAPGGTEALIHFGKAVDKA